MSDFFSVENGGSPPRTLCFAKFHLHTTSIEGGWDFVACSHSWLESHSTSPRIATDEALLGPIRHSQVSTGHGCLSEKPSRHTPLSVEQRPAQVVGNPHKNTGAFANGKGEGEDEKGEENVGKCDD